MTDPFNHEPPIDPLDDTNPSQRIDLSKEPPIDPLDDTNPSKSQQMRAVRLDEPPISADDTSPSLAVRPDALRPGAAPLPVWRRVVGVLSLLGAMAFTAGATVLVLLPPPPPDVPPTSPATSVAAAPTNTPPPPTEVIPTDEAVVAAAQQADSFDALPTISAEQAAAFLQQPVSAAAQAQPGVSVVRNPYTPFTIIPDRPRGEVIQYAVEQGDTISTISEKFGISPESVVWANDRNIVNIIRPGQLINIVPVDGVYIPRHVGDRTIAEYAAQYGIDDPFTIIDSEYNPQLRGLTPQSIPDSGTPIMIVNGEAEQISWTPTVEREPAGPGGSGLGFITFAPGEPGSCGRQENPGGGASWSPPLGNYTWMRGFTSFHTGVDLAASIGTPVRAARSGRVIFAGWNSFGYGYTVVLAHGPFTTLYGHMSSVNVGCGQDVPAGTTVGAVGNTGNSSGPHLHFEIRFNDQPQDPTLTIPF